VSGRLAVFRPNRSSPDNNVTSPLYRYATNIGYDNDKHLGLHSDISPGARHRTENGVDRSRLYRVVLQRCRGAALDQTSGDLFEVAHAARKHHDDEGLGVLVRLDGEVGGFWLQGVFLPACETEYPLALRTVSQNGSTQKILVPLFAKNKQGET